jgi:N-acetylglucosamine-6-phosphate deacetylase
MDTMVRTMASQTSARLPEVIRMASLTPAERAGVSRETGSLEVGKWADLLVLSPGLEVKQVFVRGQEYKGELQSDDYGKSPLVQRNRYSRMP